MNLSSGFAYKNSCNHSKDEFLDGLSAADIHTILYDLFNIRSPLRLSASDVNALYYDIPILRMSVNFIIVGDDYGFIDIRCFNNLSIYLDELFCNISESPSVDNDMSKTAKLYLHLLFKSGLIRKAGINWIFTQKAKSCLNDKSLLLKYLLEGIGYGFNWKLFDNISAKGVGQLAFGISLIMLVKYGNEYRPFSFYADKYLHFFDLISNLPDSPNIEMPNNIKEIYSNRTFNCFAKIFGFVEIDNSFTDPLVKSSANFKKIFMLNS